MEIEELVKNAIDEFGDRAHERFWYPLGEDSFIPESNEMLIGILRDEKDCTDLELLPLPELFAHGCDVYGFEQEVKMWEFSWVDNEDDSSYYWSRCSTPIDNNPFLRYRRKKSAAREFCLEDAKAGDVVEVLNPDCLWIPCKYLYEYTDKRIVMMIGTLSEVVKKEDLRMKYPKKLVQS